MVRIRSGSPETFETWMELVDLAVQSSVGLSVYDLADMPFRDRFDDEYTPRAVAVEVLQEAGF